MLVMAAHLPSLSLIACRAVASRHIKACSTVLANHATRFSEVSPLCQRNDRLREWWAISPRAQGCLIQRSQLIGDVTSRSRVGHQRETKEPPYWRLFACQHNEDAMLLAIERLPIGGAILGHCILKPEVIQENSARL